MKLFFLHQEGPFTYKQNNFAKQKRNLYIIIGITVLNAIGMTIVFPLFPFLLGKYVPAARVAVVMSALVSVFAVCTFFAAPVFGALSDRYGRKSILLISLLGSAIGYLLLGMGGALLEESLMGLQRAIKAHYLLILPIVQNHTKEASGLDILVALSASDL